VLVEISPVQPWCNPLITRRLFDQQVG